LPRSASSITAVAVATTLVSEARSYSVLSGEAAGEEGDHVSRP
jgi:hypothetical protein